MDESNWTIGNSLTVSSDEVFVVYVRVTDNAGNVDYFCSDGAILDTVNAGITLTPSNPAADNGNADVYGYYNDDVTVNVKVTDAAPYSGIKTVEYWVTADGVETQRETRFNFTKENPKFNELVSSWEDNIVIDAEKNNSCNVILNVKVTDNAGNEITESIALDIDVTNPTVSVSYNNNAPANGKYFDGTRTATIQITERSHHFTEPTVYINPETYPESDTNCIIIYATDANGETVTFVPEITWNPPVVDENNPDNTVYTANILYDVDANYTFEIKVMDKATNQNTAVNAADSAAPYEFAIAKATPTGSVSILTNTWDNATFTNRANAFGTEKEKAVTADGNLSVSVRELDEEISSLTTKKNQAVSDRDYYKRKCKEKLEEEGKPSWYYWF